ncbi:MAG: DUF6504 family protein, partial [Chloroflexota bacterium]
MRNPEPRPVHFLDQPIEVSFRTPPTRAKLPHCPDGFIVGETTYRIVETLSEWTDFTRRGRAERNMQPAHAAVASHRGSLNVGRFFFRVRVDSGQLFDLYYDRAAKNVDQR